MNNNNNFNMLIVLQDGSYGPLAGAQIIAVPEGAQVEEIEEIIDAVSMFDHNPSDLSEGFLVGNIG